MMSAEPAAMGKSIHHLAPCEPMRGSQSLSYSSSASNSNAPFHQRDRGASPADDLAVLGCQKGAAEDEQPVVAVSEAVIGAKFAAIPPGCAVASVATTLAATAIPATSTREPFQSPRMATSASKGNSSETRIS